MSTLRTDQEVNQPKVTQLAVIGTQTKAQDI